MVSKIEKAKVPDKIKMFNDYDEMRNRIIKDSEEKIKELNTRREVLIIHNRQLEEQLVRRQSEFEQWKRLEEEKIKDMKNKFNNDQIVREKKLEVGELDLSRRNEECIRREAIGKVAVEKEAKLNNDRIEIEKLRSSANLMMDNAQRKMSDALSVESQANIKLAKAKEIENKANAINESIIKRENDVLEKEKEMSLATKNLEELKLIVEPKILEIKIREDKVNKDKEFVLEKEREVENKINEEKIMLRDLDILTKRNKDREKQLDQKEEDITRKALIAGIKEDKK
jgi:hypothetical protein